MGEYFLPGMCCGVKKDQVYFGWGMEQVQGAEQFHATWRALKTPGRCLDLFSKHWSRSSREICTGEPRSKWLCRKFDEAKLVSGISRKRTGDLEFQLG